MKHASSITNGVVQCCPENPRYLAYKGNPVILITSAEPYGAVINLDFDYKTYLERLSSFELNYTRIYPGGYLEKEGMFIEENVMAPAPGRLAVPWARSDARGYAAGGNKFDLNRWDAGYFSRLQDFMVEAERRGIVVEICFFNCQYPEGWSDCPLNATNNIQGIGTCAPAEFQTLREPELVRVQEEYIRKIVQEVNSFDNVILEICDEPTLKGTPGEEAVAWIDRLADVIVETERTLPKKHLIAQQLEVGVDFTDDARIPLIVAQYVEQNENRQVGGIEALDCEYGHNKPIEFNETSVFPIWYKGDQIADSRVEAWEFLVGGGAAFNQHNSLYTVRNPAGKTPENEKILGALRILKHFMEGFRFEKMRQDTGFLKGPVPHGAHIRCISEPGVQYALYIHHSVIHEHLDYIVTPGDYSAALDVDLPAGRYRFEWIDPETGRAVLSDTFAHRRGEASSRTEIHNRYRLEDPLRGGAKRHE